MDITGQRARQVRSDDFFDFDRIIALDHQNLADLRALAPDGAAARLGLLLDHVPGREGQSVADPWFGEDDGFDVTWDEVTAAARALAAKLSR